MAAHRELTNVGVLHRDVSMANILVVKDEELLKKSIHGILIDHDMAFNTRTRKDHWRRRTFALCASPFRYIDGF